MKVLPSSRQAMYARVSMPSADFAGLCALPMIAHTSLLIHPIIIRELTLAKASHSKDERDRWYVSCPVRSIRYEALGHELIYVVVVAVLQDVNLL